MTECPTPSSTAWLVLDLMVIIGLLLLAIAAWWISSRQPTAHHPDPEPPAATSVDTEALEQLSGMRTYERDIGSLPECSVQQMVWVQVQLTPRAVALQQGSATTTYSQLWTAAGTLACRLVGSGVAPGGCVGLIADPGSALVVGILGVLRANCCYSPLSASLPLERLKFMVANCAISAVVYTTAHELLANQLHPLALAVEQHNAKCPITVPTASAADPFVLMYTSGSTGELNSCAAC